MDQFNLELESALTPEAVGARPGNILVPVSNHYALYHLGNVLDRIKPGRRDVVVLHVRILQRSATGENELDAEQLFGSIEQHLFSQALSMAEKRGKSIRLAVVASNDLWEGILRAGQSLQSSTIVVGTSNRWMNEEQARTIGDAWEKLGEYLCWLQDLPASSIRATAEPDALEWKRQMESRMLAGAWATMHSWSHQRQLQPVL